MSDIERPALDRIPTPIAHRCHCGDWAGFGFTPPGGRQETQWWCWEHYPYRDHDARLQAGMIADLHTS